MPTPRPIPALLAVTIALALAAPTRSRADSWSPPKTFQVDSKEGRHRLTVEPANGNPFIQLFQNHPDEASRPKARGKLEEKTEAGEFRIVWERPLTNDVSPTSALVADDGSVVTLDNWHSMGYGSNVVVVYDRDGKLVRSMGLEDFLAPEVVKGLPHSVSSIWWGRGHHLDEKQETLILNIGNSLSSSGDDEAAPAKSIRVRLKTGEIVDEQGRAEPATKKAPSSRSKGR
ncbi:hypothetical protein [Paludisphaera soli]|uniref:hypothetical protein n=1 Tax=Paludisphaera soli TaxID=2712865 RepID=UPI0013ECBB34|nr:hypothetical protein [Paludisphaera soli]